MAAEVFPADPPTVDPMAELLDPQEQAAARAQPLIAGLVSALFHLAFFIVLAACFMPRPPERRVVSLSSAAPWQRPDELVTEELGRSLDPVPMTAAAAAPKVDRLDASAAIKVDMPLETSLAVASPGLELASLMPNREVLDVLAKTRGNNARAAVDSSAQAIERLTEELAQLLSHRPLLVTWCFDQSGSMRPEREEIRKRIAKIYAELGLLGAAKDNALLTSVASFGKDFLVHTQKPAADPAEIEKAISAVPLDDSGVEIICQAVAGAMRTQRKWLGRSDGDSPDLSERQLVVILVTDESGQRSDNLAYLEKVIDDAKRLGARIYVIGREATFGCPYDRVIWTDPETKVRVPVLVDRGPETAFVEVVQFTGSGRPTDFLASGFGPYDQVRMARETGGLFFLLPGRELGQRARQIRDAQLNELRHYLPELDSRSRYIEARSQSPLRRAVWDVVSELDAWDDAKARELTFPGSLSIDPKAFVAQAGLITASAQRLLRVYDRSINSLQRAADSRRDEARRRWQANYDLLLAQLISWRARTNELVACLAPYLRDAPEVKNVYGEEKKTNYWRLQPKPELAAAEKTKADVDRATRLFAELIANHPDTPWARRASAEAARPYGVALAEGYSPPRDPPPKVQKPNL